MICLSDQALLARRPQTSFRRARHARPSRLAVVVLSLVTAGCAADSEGPPGAIPEPVEFTSDGLAMVRETPRSRLWVKPDHHIGRYDAILVSGIGFQYGQGQEALNPIQEKQIGQMLVDALVDFTEGTPVGHARESGPCVVALQLVLKDIFLHVGEAEGSAISFVSSFGSATMVVEFRDSETNTTLPRYAANRGLGGGQESGRVGANLQRLGRALSRMVTDMTTELQTIVPNTTVLSDAECNDGIFKLTGRG